MTIHLKPLQKLIGAWLRNTNRTTASPIATMAHRQKSSFPTQTNQIITTAFCKTLLLLRFSHRLPNLVITFPNSATRCTPDSSCGTPKPERDESGKARKYRNRRVFQKRLLLRRSRNPEKSKNSKTPIDLVAPGVRLVRPAGYFATVSRLWTSNRPRGHGGFFKANYKIKAESDFNLIISKTPVWSHRSMVRSGRVVHRISAPQPANPPINQLTNAPIEFTN